MGRFFKSRLTSIAACMTVIVGLTLGYNRAEAIIGEDIPILTSIFGQQVREGLQLGGLLAQAGMIVSEVKETVNLAKAIYCAFDELRHMTWKDLGGYVMQGLDDAFPEVGQMYDDIKGTYQNIKDFGDLKKVDPLSVTALRGMLWDEVYGPALDAMGIGKKSLDELAETEELLYRATAQQLYFNEQTKMLDAACQKDASACEAASYKATVLQATQLAGLAELARLDLRVNRGVLERMDLEKADSIYMAQRWLWDAQNYAQWMSGIDAMGSCSRGNCIYEAFGAHLYKKISQYHVSQDEMLRLERLKQQGQAGSFDQSDADNTYENAIMNNKLDTLDQMSALPSSTTPPSGSR
jgi:hypothetical protein